MPHIPQKTVKDIAYTNIHKLNPRNTTAMIDRAAKG